MMANTNILKILILFFGLSLLSEAYALTSIADKNTLISGFNSSSHSTSWNAGLVQFVLSSPDNAMYEKFLNFYLSNGSNGLIPHNEGRTYTFSWKVDNSYDIEISNVTINVDRATGANSFITVGDGPRTGDLFATLSSVDLSTGSHIYTTSESISIVFEKATTWSTVAVNSITVTYTLIPKFIFDGSGDGSEGDSEHLRWGKADNWLHNIVPTINDKVYIRHNVVIENVAFAKQMIIEGTNYVTITPNGDLKIGTGGISNATTENLKLAAETTGVHKGKTGCLRIDPAYTGALPNATVELYSIAFFDMNADDRNNVASWQYVGSPMSAGTAAKSVFPSSWCYNWDEATGAWKNNRKNLTLQPFVGYATSQYTDPDGLLISHQGQLASNGDKVLSLTYSASSAEPGVNVFANSYTAPIDITKMQVYDFSTGVEATIHLFNTGSKNDVEAREGQETDIHAVGQYISIPVGLAKDLVENHGYPGVIPPMQGFYVTTTQAGTVTLDYQRIVWEATYSNTHLHAPKREQEESKGSLCVSLSADGWSDKLYLLESEDYSATFENGFDAHKMMSGNLNIYSIEGTDSLAVDATNSLVGTRIGVRTSEETSYTIVFNRVNSEQELALLDQETSETIDITEGTHYSFFAEPNSVLSNRFRIIARTKAITTDLDKVEGDSKVHKFIKDNQLYILKNGVLYNVMGTIVQ